MKILTRKEAYVLAQTEEKIDFAVDGLVHPISTLVYMRELSARTRYQHPKDANHSPGLGFYYWLQKHKLRVWVIWERKPGELLRTRTAVAVKTDFNESTKVLDALRLQHPTSTFGREKCYYTQAQIDSF